MIWGVTPGMASNAFGLLLARASINSGRTLGERPRARTAEAISGPRCLSIPELKMAVTSERLSQYTMWVGRTKILQSSCLQIARPTDPPTVLEAMTRPVDIALR